MRFERYAALLAVLLSGLLLASCGSVRDSTKAGPPEYRATPDRLPPAGARGMIRAGDRAIVAGNILAAQEHYARALAAAQRDNDRGSQGAAYLRLAAVHTSMGEYERAQDYAGKALALATARGDSNLLAASHRQLGRVHTSLGNLRRAAAHFKGAMDEYRQLGNLTGAARTLSDLALLELRARRPERAVRTLEIALRMAERERNLHLVASIHGRIGLASYFSGRYRKAITHYRIAVRVQDGYANRTVSAKNYRGMGAAYLKLGDQPNACTALSTARTRYSIGRDTARAERMNQIMTRAGC